MSVGDDHLGIFALQRLLDQLEALHGAPQILSARETPERSVYPGCDNVNDLQFPQPRQSTSLQRLVFIEACGDIDIACRSPPVS